MGECHTEFTTKAEVPTASTISHVEKVKDGWDRKAVFIDRPYFGRYPNDPQKDNWARTARIV